MSKSLEEIFRNPEDAKSKEQRKKEIELCAKLALKFGKHTKRTQDDVRSMWEGDSISCPSALTLGGRYQNKDIIGILQNDIVLSHDIWNADFMQGVCRNGKIFNPPYPRYKSFIWFSNLNISELISICPFGGKIGGYLHSKRADNHKRWSSAPVLNLKYNANTLSFIAGVLCVGQIVERNGKVLVSYRRGSIDVIKDLNIPIEAEEQVRNIGYPSVLISPFWPALFSLKMPLQFRSRWFNLENTVNSTLYAAILWRTYIDSYFPTNALPYLKCKKQIYNIFRCEEGAITYLERMAKEKGLIYIDLKMRDMVNMWSKLVTKLYNREKRKKKT